MLRCAVLCCAGRRADGDFSLVLGVVGGDDFDSSLVIGGGDDRMISSAEGDLYGVNLRRCFLLRKVTLPEPLTFTTYW